MVECGQCFLPLEPISQRNGLLQKLNTISKRVEESAAEFHPFFSWRNVSFVVDGARDIPVDFAFEIPIGSLVFPSPPSKCLHIASSCVV